MEPQSISSDLIRGHIDTIILHTLLDGDKFAQQISDSIESKSESEYKINQATLYSSLKRLENLKFVTSYWNDSDAGGRRKYFKLTELGKNTVDSSLLNWSYSRGIIDKLMDCAPQPVYRTQVVERTVEVQREITPILEKPIEEKAAQEVKTLSEPVKIENIETQEINFRNILNGLIKYQSVKSNDEVEELSPINDVEVIENSNQQKFNETLSAIDYTAQRVDNGKIDFGDLTLKAAKEGYKIKISSKDSHAQPGTFLINKLNFFSALIIYLLVLAEFLVVTFAYKSFVNFTPLIVSLLIAGFTVFPFVLLVIYLKQPQRKINKKPSVDSILTSAIIVFNVLMVTIACALLFKLDFNNKQNVLSALVTPVILSIDSFLFFVLRYFISKSKAFISKNKKTTV